MKRKRTIVSWSGGKDSCLACYKVLQAGHHVLCLVNTISDDFKRVRFHGVEGRLIQIQADALGIPLLQKETSAQNYDQEFIELLSKAVDQGADSIVFGDIHLQHCYDWAKDICSKLNVELIEPLWQRDQEEILTEFVAAGFESIVVSTQAELLNDDWLGRKIDQSFIDGIKAVGNIDLCGENGEFHTFVTNGPIFKHSIPISQHRTVRINGYWFLDVRENYSHPKKFSHTRPLNSLD